jgi:hypothetical protein
MLLFFDKTISCFSSFIQIPYFLTSSLQAFKYLEDRDSCDGGDSLYCCLWDMAILEFAMSLHTRYHTDRS